MSKSEHRRNLTASQTKEMWVNYYDSLEGEENKESFKADYERYTKIHSWDNAIRIILDKGNISNGDTILDAGCGWGRMLMGVISQRRELKISAIDISAPALEIGKKLIGEKRNENSINWQEGNLESLPYDDDTFDVVYSARVFQHVDNPPAAIDEVLRVLKPGGVFVIFLQNKLNPLNARYYSNLYTPHQLQQWFNKERMPSELRVQSMDFFPNFLGFFPKGMRMALERVFESIPGINKLGGKVLAYGRK